MGCLYQFLIGTNLERRPWIAGHAERVPSCASESAGRPMVAGCCSLVGEWCPSTMVCLSAPYSPVERIPSRMLNRRHPGLCRFGCAAVAVPDGGVGRCLASQNPVLRLGGKAQHGERQVLARGVPWPPVGGFPQESDILGLSGQLTTVGGILFLQIVGGGLVPYIVCKGGLYSQVALGWEE